MKYFFYIIFILMMTSTNSSAVTADELVHIHRVTTSEMGSIASPKAGDLVYNTTINSIYFYTGSIWKRMRPDGSETIIHAGTDINVTGNGTYTTPYTIGLIK